MALDFFFFFLRNLCCFRLLAGYHCGRYVCPINFSQVLCFVCSPIFLILLVSGFSFFSLNLPAVRRTSMFPNSNNCPSFSFLKTSLVWDGPIGLIVFLIGTFFYWHFSCLFSPGCFPLCIMGTKVCKSDPLGNISLFDFPIALQPFCTSSGVSCSRCSSGRHCS